MIDPILSLAFSMHSNKGVYALLIGSGVSRSAGIPTGWEVVKDLIRKVAHLKGEDCEPDPAAWFEAKLRKKPDYAKLLDAIVKSPPERSKLLRSYFEPSEEERDRGLKVPTAAHKAIGELVASEYIRVIVTTNFDRLLEMALEAVGVVPTVISTPDAVKGALPLTHTRCTIIKVHGDYLDTRIKNTPRELEKYDKPLNLLLDRVFDEFGLIVCGWSAEWDTALRCALERCKSHRFTTFWALRREPKEPEKSLIKLRRAEVVKVQGADSFFQEIAEKVSSLEDIARPHPLSVKIAVATVKKYLAEGHHKIRLHDLVVEETEKLYGELSEENFPVQGVPFSGEELWRRVQGYEALTEVLQALMTTGCYWGEEVHEKLWVKCLERIAGRFEARAGFTVWLNLRLYPALLLLYSGGIASIAADRYGAFSALLTEAKIRDEGKDLPVVLNLFAWKVMDENTGRKLPGMEGRPTPLSDYLCNVLREPLKEFLPQVAYYQECFDRFEYLLALVHADLYHKEKNYLWGPLGCFSWRYRRSGEQSIMEKIGLEFTDEGINWPPLKAGLFDGSPERFQSIKKVFDEN